MDTKKENLDKEVIDLFLKKAKEDLTNREIVNYLQTDIHEGRHLSAMLTEEEGVFIKCTSYHMPGHKPTVMHLSFETFSFLLEALLHVEKEFGIDRKKNLSKITGGSGKIKYKKSLSLNTLT